MTTSDSEDDDNYTDYLSKRRAAVQAKRKNGEFMKNYDDSDEEDSDEEEEKRRNDAKRRKEEEIEEDEVNESLMETESHEVHLKEKMERMEEEYKRSLFKGSAFIVGGNNGQVSSVLTTTMKLCENMDGVTNQKTENEEIEILMPASPAGDSSITAEMFPVTVDILDCEKTKQTVRHEIPISSNFEEIFIKYAKEWKCTASQVILTYNGSSVERTCTPKDLGLKAMQIPYPRMDISRIQEEERENGEKIPVFTIENTPNYLNIKAQFRDRRKPIQIQVYPETTVEKMKELIICQLEEENEVDIPTAENMKVMFDDEYLTDNDATCQDIGLEDDDCLDIYC